MALLKNCLQTVVANGRHQIAEIQRESCRPLEWSVSQKVEERKQKELASRKPGGGGSEKQ